MKPFRILAFFLAVFALLLGISFIFPRDGIALGEDLRLRFLNSAELFARDSATSTYTDSLIRFATVTDDPEFGEVDSLLLMPEVEIDINQDSIIRARIDSIRKRVFPLVYEQDGQNMLATFFSAAEASAEKGELLRILHYGDSQIENDRMTSLLRYRFQRVFGGSGVGMVPAIPLYFGNPTFRESFNGDWIRYTGFGRRDSTLTHRSYGSLLCFTSVPLPSEEGLPSLEFKYLPGRKASRFNHLEIYLHSYVDSGMVIVNVNDTIVDTLEVRDGFQVLKHKTRVHPKKLQMHFKLNEGGRIYGLSFDPAAGVQVDNIAMRGSSGIELSRSDREVLDLMFSELNPGLILMQFGGNVVPYITNFAYYKYTFKKELNYLKKLLPGVPVIVIGPSDMATKENGKFLTYPTLEPVRDVLKEAALESGYAFWDMYEAMGGYNSVQDFVMADPPLASSDYIHFTPKGANMMAGMLFDAVMLEYGRYKAEEEAMIASEGAEALQDQEAGMTSQEQKVETSGPEEEKSSQ